MPSSGQICWVFLEKAKKNLATPPPEVLLNLAADLLVALRSSLSALPRLAETAALYVVTMILVAARLAARLGVALTFDLLADLVAGFVGAVEFLKCVQACWRICLALSL